MTTATAAKPPSWLRLLGESRSILEFGSFNLLRMPLTRLPKGDGHPVLVMPGFLASDMSTRPMRSLLKDLDYKAYGWGLGRNLRFNKKRDEQLSTLLKRVNDETGEKVSIVGWSLGGVFAREMAKKHPERVRSVISLGSPITSNRNYSNAKRMFETINGTEFETHFKERIAALAEAPPVPTTSIYTKSDGVVSWRGSIQKPGYQAENIRVPASHIGLGVNPVVMVAIADRLAQEEGAWRPFSRSGWRKAVFRDTPEH